MMLYRSMSLAFAVAALVFISHSQTPKAEFCLMGALAFPMVGIVARLVP